ncbi:hypothetical protein FA95DRAFT_1609599 [Auriscalpium vulgare]|uniref:Uncharacterized protein n=1 Tax=Auriscalpium vulgare TaxID=40419 RepID=A0ACB8RGX2_9AGAM|nr:hypothetical protein FA95DRAFT_1609599 [Auriscalpium vulgare]
MPGANGKDDDFRHYAFEVAYAPASDAYIADQTIIRPAFELLRKYDGVHEIYSGVELEDPSILVAIAWDSLKAHQAYEKQPEYKSYIDYLTPCLKGGATPVHVYFTANPMPAFNASVTEVIWVTAKAGDANQAATLKTLDKILEFANNSPDSLIHASYGSVLENAGTFCVVIGWSSFKEKAQVRPKTYPTVGNIVGDGLQLAKAVLKLVRNTVLGDPQGSMALEPIIVGLTGKAVVEPVHCALTKFV